MSEDGVVHLGPATADNKRGDYIARARVMKPYSIPRDAEVIETIKWAANHHKTDAHTNANNQLLVSQILQFVIDLIACSTWQCNSVGIVGIFILHQRQYDDSKVIHRLKNTFSKYTCNNKSDYMHIHIDC
eukprot:151082_1